MRTSSTVGHRAAICSRTVAKAAPPFRADPCPTPGPKRARAAVSSSRSGGGRPRPGGHQRCRPRHGHARGDQHAGIGPMAHAGGVGIGRGAMPHGRAGRTEIHRGHAGTRRCSSRSNTCVNPLGGPSGKSVVGWRLTQGVPYAPVAHPSSGDRGGSQTIRRLAQSRTEPARLVERARIVWQAHHGHRVPAIARTVGVCEATVRNWLTRFNAGGPAALQDSSRAGRPRPIPRPRSGRSSLPV